jgi:hypothetical protein
MNSGGEGGDGLGSRIDVGGFGVVVVGDAVFCGDIFEAMFDGLKAGDGLADGFGRNVGEARCGYCG